MTEPTTTAPRDFGDIYDGVTLRLSQAKSIINLAIDTEGELTPVFVVIREQIEAAEGFAEQLWKITKEGTP